MNGISLIILSAKSINYNLNPNTAYFQTRDIVELINEKIRNEQSKRDIINANPFKDRYNCNNDVFIHVRLTDVAQFNPGIDYYLKAINKSPMNGNIYISTDDTEHQIIKDLIVSHPNAIILKYEEIETIQFASTCKYIVLSHGTFSFVIALLGFYSIVYYQNVQLKI